MLGDQWPNAVATTDVNAMASKSGHPAYPPRGRSGSPPSPSPRSVAIYVARRYLHCNYCPWNHFLHRWCSLRMGVQTEYSRSCLLLRMATLPFMAHSLRVLFFEWMDKHSGGQLVLFSGSHIISWPAPSSNDHHLASSPNGHFSRAKDQAIINEIRGFLLCRLKNSHPDQTLISDVFVRGVTGGECKPGSIAKMMINRARIQC